MGEFGPVKMGYGLNMWSILDGLDMDRSNMSQVVPIKPDPTQTVSPNVFSPKFPKYGSISIILLCNLFPETEAQQNQRKSNSNVHNYTETHTEIYYWNLEVFEL